MESNLSDRLKNISCLRRNGEFKEAIGHVNALLNIYPHNEQVLAEAVRLSILTKQYARAYTIYLQLKTLPEGESAVGGGAITRLKIVTDGEKKSAITLPENIKEEGWVSIYQAQRKDPIYPVSIQDCSVTCHNQFIVYKFTIHCRACKSLHHIKIYRTFLIQREYLCPECFARQYVDYEIIKKYAEKRFAHLLSGAMYRFDYFVMEILRQLNEDALKGEKVPFLCRYLSQDYAYALNQFVIDRLYNKKDITI